MSCRMSSDGTLLAQFEAQAESQLVLLDLSILVDVTVTHQGFPELVQVCATDAGLHGAEGQGVEGVTERSQIQQPLMESVVTEFCSHLSPCSL